MPRTQAFALVDGLRTDQDRAVVTTQPRQRDGGRSQLVARFP